MPSYEVNSYYGRKFLKVLFVENKLMEVEEKIMGINQSLELCLGEYTFPVNKEFIKKIYLIFLGIEGDHLSVLLKTFLYTTVNRRLMRETVTGIDDVYDAYKKIYFIFEDEVKKRDEVSARHKQFVDNLDTAIETIKS